jgi:hypothetical protein
MKLTRQRLLEVLRYDPDSGHFFWVAPKMRPKARLGLPAGTPDRDGYVMVRIDRRGHMAHRLAFLYMTGEWPEKQVDHINGLKNDNRWSNLRDVSASVNSQNKRVRGITSHKGRWLARICVNGRRTHLGWFNSPELARAAYVAAKRELHPGCAVQGAA